MQSNLSDVKSYLERTARFCYNLFFGTSWAPAESHIQKVFVDEITRQTAPNKIEVFPQSKRQRGAVESAFVREA